MKTYIIAEIGNTHEGSLGLAKQFIKAATECGVDAVKMQTHIFEAESLLDAPNPPYFKDETRKEYFERTAFTIEQWKELKRYSEEDLKIDFFSSPFSLEAVDMLEVVGMNTYKIASGEVNNIPLLEKVAKTGKRVLLSSGMSSWTELDEAVEILQSNGCKDLIVLQCTSEYPCPPKEAGLNVLDEMRTRYENVTIGYSDHTMGVAVPLAAVIKGAMVIEKHFTLSQKMYGSDAMNSTEPEEFKRLVDEIREIEIALSNNVNKDEKVKSLGNMKMTFEKSIVSTDSIDEHDIITFDKLSFKKPGNGIPAKEYKKLLGKKLSKSVDKDYKFKIEDFI
ncbi:MAG: N,N'-diacetyllegionaminate synthase [Sulfurimonas sp.]|jgi:N,N'-diacetyllegionaminate synthase